MTELSTDSSSAVRRASPRTVSSRTNTRPSPPCSPYFPSTSTFSPMRSSDASPSHAVLSAACVRGFKLSCNRSYGSSASSFSHRLVRNCELSGGEAGQLSFDAHLSMAAHIATSFSTCSFLLSRGTRCRTAVLNCRSSSFLNLALRHQRRQLSSPHRPANVTHSPFPFFSTSIATNVL